MEKLIKLQVRTTGIIKNEELLILRGGYDDCHCMCYSRDPIPQPMGLMAAINQTDCYDNCGELGWTGTWNCMYY